MQRHLVLVGGGHAHLSVLTGLDRIVGRGHRATLISPDAYHYYSGMGPGLVGGFYHPREIRFHIEKMARDRGADFIRDHVVAVDSSVRKLFLSSGLEVHYDVVSFNTGSLVPRNELTEFGPREVPVKPIINLLKVSRLLTAEHRHGIKNILVVGGGPAGVEIAGNLQRLVERESGGERIGPHISLIAGNRLLPGFPSTFRDQASDSLGRRSIEVKEGVRAERLEAGRAFLSDGSEQRYDLALVATGVKPSGLFENSDLPIGADGGLLVNDCLQGVSCPEIFGGGDCICFQPQALDKVGVYAVRQNQILLHNLLAAMENRPLKAFRPQKRYLLILNLGNGTGLLHHSGIVWRGRTAFRIKDWIDRRFMKRFQVSGERNGP